MQVAGKLLHDLQISSARRQEEQEGRTTAAGWAGAHPALRRAVGRHQLSAPGGSRGAGAAPTPGASSADELKALASNLLIYPDFFSLRVLMVGAIWTGAFISLE